MASKAVILYAKDGYQVSLYRDDHGLWLSILCPQHSAKVLAEDVGVGTLSRRALAELAEHLEI